MMRPQDYRRAVGSIRWSPAQRKEIEAKLREAEESSRQLPENDTPICIPHIQKIYEEQEARMKKERKQARFYLLILAAAVLTIGGTVAAVAWSSRNPKDGSSQSDESKPEKKKDDPDTQKISPKLTGQLDSPYMHCYPQTDSGFFYLGSSMQSDADMNQQNVSQYFGRMDQNDHWNTYGLKYYDAASGKSVYVCAKPNCLHDGNEFCTATTKNYTPLCDPVWLDGYVYMIAVNNTELRKNPNNCTKYPTVLLRYAPDGTEVTELTQIHLSENPYYAYADMIAHRGQLWINYAYEEWIITQDSNMNSPWVETKGSGAMYCYEPEAKKLTELYSTGEPQKDYNPAKDSRLGILPQGSVMYGDGDYVYFQKRIQDWRDKIKGAGIFRIDCRTGKIEQNLKIASRKSEMWCRDGDYIFYSLNPNPSNGRDLEGKLLFHSYNTKTQENIEFPTLFSIAKEGQPWLETELLKNDFGLSKTILEANKMISVNGHLYVFWTIHDYRNWNGKIYFYVSEFAPDGTVLHTAELNQTMNTKFPEEQIRAETEKNGYSYTNLRWVAPDEFTNDDITILKANGCWETEDGDWIHPSTLHADDIDRYLETGCYLPEYVYVKPEDVTEEIIQKAIGSRAEDSLTGGNVSFDGTYFYLSSYIALYRLRPEDLFKEMTPERVLFWEN